MRAAPKPLIRSPDSLQESVSLFPSWMKQPKEKECFRPLNVIRSVALAHLAENCRQVTAIFCRLGSGIFRCSGSTRNSGSSAVGVENGGIRLPHEEQVKHQFVLVLQLVLRPVRQLGPHLQVQRWHLV